MVTEVTEGGVTYNKTDISNSWRLIYNPTGTTADLFMSVGATSSIYTIEEFSTEQEGLDRITTLGKTRNIEEEGITYE